MSEEIIGGDTVVISGVANSELRDFVEKRDIRDRAKAEFEAAERDYREIEAFVWEKMDENGDQILDRELPGEGRVHIDRRSTIYSRVLDTDILLDSLENEGRVEEMTKPGFEKKRLNEFVRECLETGRPLPDGVDFYEKRYLRFSRKGD